jgi:hypothetical protein
MSLSPSVITSRHDRLSRDEKDEYDRCLAMLERAGSVTPFGCVYVIERVGDPAYYKAGLTSLDNLENRMGNLQTGDPLPQRVVSLCMFYSRAVASIVERGLKTDYQRRGLHAKGGTEWYSVPREDIVADIRRVSHRLAIEQIMANATDGRVNYIDEALRTHFYGLLIFDIRDGELIDFAEVNSAKELMVDVGSSGETRTEPPIAVTDFLVPTDADIAGSKLRSWVGLITLADGLWRRFV